MRERNPKPATDNEYGGGFSKETIENLQKRSDGFHDATQRKGRPMIYGTGTPAPEKKAKAKR